MFSDFLLKNWFDLLQTIFIIIGFILTYRADRSDARSGKVEHLLSLSQSYRDIWSKTYSQPELLRIIKSEVDLEKHPITEAEERMVKEMILHIYTIYMAVKNNQLEGDEIKREFADYFRLPIPNAVWQEIKIYHNKQFVSYIDNLLN